MHYISHITVRLLFTMKDKKNYLIFYILLCFSACSTTPFTELNSRDNFHLEDSSNFHVSLNIDFMPTQFIEIIFLNQIE